jgi:hypothetical protein
LSTTILNKNNKFNQTMEEKHKEQHAPKTKHTNKNKAYEQKQKTKTTSQHKNTKTESSK